MYKFRPFKQVPKLIFGPDSLNRIEELIPFKIENEYILLVFDVFFKKNLPKILENFDIEIIFFDSKKGEPKTEHIDLFRNEILKKRSNIIPKVIVGIGGGSAMDVAKSLSIVFTNEGIASDFQGWDLVKEKAVYKIGVPTIAGSGSEASRTAVLTSGTKKMGINSDYSMFDAIILDENLLKTVPNETFVFSAMDCFVHCVESLQGTFKNELSESIASKALELCSEALLNDKINYSKLLTASYLGGVSIVNSEVGICHALSYGLSLEYNYRHGYANTIVFNQLEEYYGDHINKFKEILKIHKIELPKNLSLSFTDSKLEKMIDMTLKMERPLENALGDNWKKILTREKVKSLIKML